MRRTQMTIVLSQLNFPEVLKMSGIDLKSLPRLSPQREKELFQALRINPEREDIKEELIVANLRLVAHWVYIIQKRQMTAKTLDFWDLFQGGVLGLMTAIDKFDPGLNYKFSTYATWWIRQAIFRTIIETGRLVRLPVHMNDRLGIFFKKIDEIRQKKGEEPSPEEIALAMNLPLQKVLELQEAVVKGEVMSLYAENDEGHSLMDMLSTGSDDLDLMVERRLLKEQVGKLLQQLAGREREIIKLRFGLVADGRARTLEEVGHTFGITRERVRQIEALALRKLRSQRSLVR